MIQDNYFTLSSTSDLPNPTNHKKWYQRLRFAEDGAWRAFSLGDSVVAQMFDMCLQMNRM